MTVCSAMKHRTGICRHRHESSMIISANITEAIRSLSGAKQRTLLALLGIVIGIGSVIAMVSVGTIVQNEALRQFRDMGTDILTVRPDAVPGRRSKRKQTFRLGDMNALIKSCPAVKSAAPYTSMFGQITCRGKRNQIPALGVTESFYDIFKLDMRNGRFVSDLDKNMYFCVLSLSLIQKFQQQGLRDLTPETCIGEKIVFNDRIFTVIGIIEEVPMGGMRPYEINDGILIPITTSQRFEDRPAVSTITIKLQPDAGGAAAAEQLTTFFKNRYRSMGIRVISAEELIEKMQKQMQLFTLLLGAIGSISLIVGGVGVMNVMLVSVSERKKEIGIRRALGAMKQDIQTQFLIESVILCFLGGVIGIGLGIGASAVISKISDWEFIMSYSSIVLGFGVSAAIGIFFGFYPARQASRLNPIQALRSE